MTILLFATLTLALALGAAIFLFRPYDYGGQAQRFERIADLETDNDDETRWRSARIRPGLNCCKIASSLQDQVFLSREIPRLPLEYCTEQNCTCHYIFLDDRRSGIDRRAQLARVTRLVSGFERRRSPGRRLSDLAA